MGDIFMIEATKSARTTNFRVSATEKCICAFLEYMKQHQLLKHAFQSQYEVGTGHRVDIAFPQCRVVIEVDGPTHFNQYLQHNNNNHNNNHNSSHNRNHNSNHNNSNYNDRKQNREIDYSKMDFLRNGHTVLRNFILANSDDGWQIVTIPFYEWNSYPRTSIETGINASDPRIAYLKQILEPLDRI
jgi:hypothetical protein